MTHRRLRRSLTRRGRRFPLTRPHRRRFPRGARPQHRRLPSRRLLWRRLVPRSILVSGLLARSDSFRSGQQSVSGGVVGCLCRGTGLSLGGRRGGGWGVGGFGGVGGVSCLGSGGAPLVAVCSAWLFAELSGCQECAG